MDTATRRALEAQVAEQVLDADDLRLFRDVRRGKTFSGIALLYKKYGNESGVREAYERARAEVRDRINNAVAASSAVAERPLDEHLLPGDDDDTAGVPIRSVPAGTIDAAGASTAPSAAGPPKPRRQPPSPERLPAVSDSPAPAKRLSNVEISRRREAALRTALANGQEITFVDAAEILGCAPGKPVESLVRRICVAAGERTGTSRALKTWRLANAPEPPPVAVARIEPPAPFAGVSAEPTDDPFEPTPEGLRLRYVDVLLTWLERELEAGSELGSELCDRIERVSGLQNGRAEQAQLAAGAGEPG